MARITLVLALILSSNLIGVNGEKMTSIVPPLSNYGLDPAQNAELLAPATAATLIDPSIAQAAATKAANDQAVNAGISRLDQQGSVGNQNILNSYNSAFQQLTGQKTADLAGLGQQRTQAQGDNQTARDNIGSSVRNVNQGLMRLLGIHGSGTSSAAQILAPFAAAQQGNQQRSQVQNAYGHNMNALDQAETNTNIGYENSFGQLANDKQQQQQTLQSSLGQQRAALLNQRSDAVNNQPAIQAILNSIIQLGLNPTFTPKAPTVAAPNLDKYAYNQTQAPQLGGNPNFSDSAAAAAGPFLSLLTGQKKQLGA
jgi:hypothetical protein